MEIYVGQRSTWCFGSTKTQLEVLKLHTHVQKKPPCAQRICTNVVSEAEKSYSDEMSRGLPRLQASTLHKSRSHTCTLHWSHHKCECLSLSSRTKETLHETTPGSVQERKLRPQPALKREENTFKGLNSTLSSFLFV